MGEVVKLYKDKYSHPPFLTRIFLIILIQYIFKIIVWKLLEIVMTLLSYGWRSKFTKNKVAPMYCATHYNQKFFSEGVINFAQTIRK